MVMVVSHTLCSHSGDDIPINCIIDQAIIIQALKMILTPLDMNFIHSDLFLIIWLYKNEWVS